MPRTTKEPALSLFLSLSLSNSVPSSLSSSLDLVQLCQPLQDHPLARLRHLPSGDKLIQDQIDTVEVEHQIELADVAEIVVQNLDKEVDSFEESELDITDDGAHDHELAQRDLSRAVSGGFPAVTFPPPALRLGLPSALKSDWPTPGLVRQAVSRRQRVS